MTDSWDEGGRFGARWILRPLSSEGGRVTVGPEGSRAPIQRKVGKDGADIGNLSPKVTQTFPTIIDVFREQNAPTPVITSGRDSSDHKKTSRHYRDEAIDLRCNKLDDDHCRAISSALQKALGSDYFVQFEKFENKDRDHIHLQYNSKPKPRSELGDELGIEDWMIRRNRATGLG
jgi:conjugal transfer mating pair stabilization protein TraG